MSSELPDFDKLKTFDTPTICNALEMIDKTRADHGYTTTTFTCLNPDNAPIVGFACTVTMRSLRPPGKDAEAIKKERLSYYQYISEAPAPKICVMQDLDGKEAGRGPLWGEFNVRIHRALGCVGMITDGSVRDVDKLPTDILILACGLRPSHANVHVVGFGAQVNVFGMVVDHGAIVHADRHGAVTFPPELADDVIVKAREFEESEAPIIEACKRDTITFAELSKLYMRR